MTYPDNEPAHANFPVLEPYDRPVEPTYEVVTPPSLPAQPVFMPEAPFVAPAAPRKKTGLVVLSIVAVLLFGAGATFGILYSDEKSRNDTLTTQLSQKDKELADSAKQVQDGKDSLTKAQDAQKRAEDGQKKAEGDAAQSAKCRDAGRTLREAAIGNDEQKGQDALLNLFIAC